MNEEENIRAGLESLYDFIVDILRNLRMSVFGSTKEMAEALRGKCCFAEGTEQWVAQVENKTHTLSPREFLIVCEALNFASTDILDCAAEKKAERARQAGKEL